MAAVPKFNYSIPSLYSTPSPNFEDEQFQVLCHHELAEPVAGAFSQPGYP